MQINPKRNCRISREIEEKGKLSACEDQKKRDQLESLALHDELKPIFISVLPRESCTLRSSASQASAQCDWAATTSRPFFYQRSSALFRVQ